MVTKQKQIKYPLKITSTRKSERNRERERERERERKKINNYRKTQKKQIIAKFPHARMNAHARCVYVYVCACMCLILLASAMQFGI